MAAGPDSPRRALGAVILAGGFGPGLAPITNSTPKSLISIGGAPVASHLVALLDELDPAMPIAVVVNAALVEAWERWNLELGQRVVTVVNGVTSAAAATGAHDMASDLALGLAVMPPVEQVVVLPGDRLIIEPLQPHVDLARASGVPVAVVRELPQIPSAARGRHDEVTVNAAQWIVHFRRKPTAPLSPLVATDTLVLAGTEAETLVDTFRRGEDSAEGAAADPDSLGGFVEWMLGHRRVLTSRLTSEYFEFHNHAELVSVRAALGDSV